MKILFKILDYLSAVLMGTATLILVTLAVSRNWNMFLAMIVGMAIGMGVLLLALLLFSSFSAVFEIFPVGMIITMLTGMSAGMAITMRGMDFRSMFIPAVLFSLLAQLTMDVYNRKLKGDVTLDDKS